MQLICITGSMGSKSQDISASAPEIFDNTVSPVSPNFMEVNQGSKKIFNRFQVFILPP